MKTRKVGRVLSLLLAIAMVVGLMIPASSVLAETTNIKTASTHNALKNLLDNASKDPNVPTRIKLTGDIVVPVAKFIYNENTFSDSDVHGYLATPDRTVLSTDEEVQAFIDQYFDGSGEGNGRFVLNRSYSVYGTPSSRKPIGAIERYYTFDEAKLEVPEGSYVVLDLNGHSIQMYPDDPVKKGYQYRGESNNDPNPQIAGDYTVKDELDQADVKVSKGGLSSVITVKGDFTLQDSSSAQTGKITGGTGNVIDSNGFSKSIKTHRYHVHASDGLLSGYEGLVTGTPGWSGYNLENYGLKGLDNTVAVNAKYRAQVCVYDFSSQKATKSCGGGVYVAPGANFTMEGGSITENVTWITATGRTYFFAQNQDLYSLGGGVYVGEGATFTMTGGSVKGNVAKSYQKENGDKVGNALGGGVYLASGATMNFYGGNVDENSTYSNTWLNTGEITAYSEGGGIYVSENAVLNMTGTEASDNRTDWPSVSGNTCGGHLDVGSNASAYMYLHGAGIQILGTANISRAIITANSFPCVTGGSAGDDSMSINVVERNLANNDVIYRDVLTKAPGTGSYEVKDDGSVIGGADYVPYTDEDENAAIGLKKVTTASTWLFGVGKTGNYSYLWTNGAGINISQNENGKDFTGVLNIGERVWCYDNWDLVTGLYAKDNGTSVTHDDVCLDQSKTDSSKWQYIGCAAPATESKIGVNFVAGVDSTQTGVQGNVIAKKANTNSLDSSVWGEYQGYEPTLTDVQFFFDNGENDIGDGYRMNSEYVIENSTYYGAPSKTVIFEPSSENGTRLLDHTGSDALGFGNTSDGYDSTTGKYKTYVMLNFNEADVHKYAQFTGSGASMKGTWGDTYKTTEAEQWLTKNDTAFGIELPRPNYSLYNGTNWASLTTYDNHTVGEAGAKNSIATQNGTERTDLYFKGYQFYSPYAHFEGLLNYVGKTTEDNRNDVELPGLLTHEFTGNNLLTWNDNKLHISVPAYTAMWYTADELADARTRVSNVKAQAVVLADGSKAIRFIALVDSRYAEYDEAGFVFSLNNATPTVEGGYDFSSKSKIYKKVMTKTSANPDGEWIDVYYMMHPDKTPAGTMKVDWTEFSDAKGILYTNIIVNDASTSTVYYATPYVRTGTTYYYGESRAISYDWLTQQDAASANS